MSSNCDICFYVTLVFFFDSVIYFLLFSKVTEKLGLARVPSVLTVTKSWLDEVRRSLGKLLAHTASARRGALASRPS